MFVCQYFPLLVLHAYVKLDSLAVSMTEGSKQVCPSEKESLSRSSEKESVYVLVGLEDVKWENFIIG